MSRVLDTKSSQDLSAITRDKTLSKLYSAETMKTMLELIPEAIIAHQNERIIFCNSSAIELFKADSDQDLLGMDPIKLAHEDDVPSILKFRKEKVLNTEMKDIRIRRNIKLDGSVFYSKSSFVKFDTPEGDVFLVFFRDITDSHKAETDREKFYHGLTRLHEIATDQSISQSDIIENVLRLGTELFGMRIGVVCQTENGEHSIRYRTGMTDKDVRDINPGEFESYCETVLNENAPVGGAIVEHNLPYKTFLGTPIIVSDRLYGGLCFLDDTPRDSEISEYEKSLLSTLATWVGNQVNDLEMAENLNRNAEKYEAVSNSASDALFIHDSNGNFVEVNRSACESLGYTKDELLKMNVDDIEIGITAEEIEQNRETYMAEEFFVVEGVHQREDGTSYPVEVQVTAIEWDGQHCKLCSARDISGRIAAEDALKESEEKFRRLFEDSGIGMIMMNLGGKIIGINNAYCRILGFEKEEMLGGNIQKFVHPDDRNETQKALDAIESGTEVEKKMLHKDGHTVWCNLNRAVVHDNNGNSLYRLGQIHDITSHKLAENALAEWRKVQNLLHSTAIRANEAENAEEAIRGCLKSVCNHSGWTLAHAFLCEEANPDILISSGIWYAEDEERFEEFMSLTDRITFEKGIGIPGKVLQQKRAIWVNVHDSDFVRPRQEQVTDLGFQVSITAPVMCGKDVVAVLEFFSEIDQPEDKTLLATASQIGTQLGRVVERDRAQRRLLAAKLSAESGNRVKTEFLANMSHELRSPLTAILGFTETMQAEIFGPIGNDKYRDYLDNIANSAEHLHAIINDVLDLSAIETGNLALNNEVCEISSLGKGALRMVSHRAEEKSLKVTDKFADSDIKIVADERRMKQIFVNLLSNAIRFTPKGGKITLGINFNDDRWLELSFTDTGIGMDEAGIKKALSKFGQVDSDLAREFEGTGLGLPLTKEMTEAHDGKLKIISEIDVGTKIVICLPPERVVN